MLTEEIKWSGRARINLPHLNSEASFLADRLAGSLTNYTKLALVSFGKVATGGTLRSVRWVGLGNRNAAQFGVASHGTFKRQVIAGKGLFFIQSGRRAGAKMPVRMVGTGPRGGKIFEPLPALIQWFNALNIPKSAWFPILRAIKRRGIKPTPVTKRAVEMAGPFIKAESALTGARIAANLIKVDASTLR